MDRPVTALLAAIALLWPVSLLPAQQNTGSPPSRRVSVTIALVDALPTPDASYVILRRTDQEPHDVILLRRSRADAAELSEAVEALVAARRVGGDRATRGATMRVRRADTREGPWTELPWAPRIIARLRNAQPHHVPGVGTVPATVIWLPRQQR